MDGEYYEGSLYINLSGIATPDDVSLGGMIVYYKLKSKTIVFYRTMSMRNALNMFSGLT